MSSTPFTGVASWEYRDMATPVRDLSQLADLETLTTQQPAPVGLTEEDVAQRVHTALAEAKQMLEAQAGERQRRRDAQLASALEDFAAKRAAYFRGVEGEVVHLALAIARKILHRETQFDPTLLAALVHRALDQMDAASCVRIRLSPAGLSAWQESHGLAAAPGGCELSADGDLEDGDCLVETKLGVANFGFEAQLKQLEQTFTDLLAHRPETR